MRKITWLALFSALGLVMACGDDGGGDDDDVMPDAAVIVFPPDASTSPDAVTVPTNCNVSTQDCNVEGYKCSVVLANNMLDVTCVEVEGMKPEGEQCFRMPDNNTTGVGHDDCDVGLYCTGRMQAPGNPPIRYCRKLCTAQSQCAGMTSDTCMGLGDIGVCLPTCTMWNDATCPAGTWCAFSGDVSGTMNVDAGECFEADVNAIGMPCGAEEGGCVAGAICLSDNVCHQLCTTLTGGDMMHACTNAAETCNELQDAVGFGVCVAM